MYIRRTHPQELEEAAKTTRQARQGTHARRGRTTSPTERALAEHLLENLRGHGVEGARVRCLATKPGAVSDVEIRLPIDKLAALARSLKGLSLRA